MSSKVNKVIVVDFWVVRVMEHCLSEKIFPSHGIKQWILMDIRGIHYENTFSWIGMNSSFNTTDHISPSEIEHF